MDKKTLEKTLKEFTEATEQYFRSDEALEGIPASFSIICTKQNGKEFVETQPIPPFIREMGDVKRFLEELGKHLLGHKEIKTIDAILFSGEVLVKSMAELTEMKTDRFNLTGDIPSIEKIAKMTDKGEGVAIFAGMNEGLEGVCKLYIVKNRKDVKKRKFEPITKADFEKARADHLTKKQLGVLEDFWRALLTRKI